MPDTGWTWYFFTLICCKNCNVCLKRCKINEKEAGVSPFKKRFNSNLAIWSHWSTKSFGCLRLSSLDVQPFPRGETETEIPQTNHGYGILKFGNHKIEPSSRSRKNSKIIAWDMLWYWFAVYLSTRRVPFVFLKMGQPRPLFRLFSSFQTNITIFTTNKCEKCPSSIRRQDLNSQPSDYESPPLTTRLGLPYLLSCQCLIKILSVKHGCWLSKAILGCT